jgi:uncharacterized protein YbcC (UPF0753/DUF2309 family)
MHEPLRLNVFTEAPLAAISEIILAHTMVQDLVDNQWLHLWAMDDTGRVAHRYQRDGEWVAV